MVGADALSRWVDWAERSTCVLFGDGAGAVVLEVADAQAAAAGAPPAPAGGLLGGIVAARLHSEGPDALALGAAVAPAGPAADDAAAGATPAAAGAPAARYAALSMRGAGCTSSRRRPCRARCAA